MSFLTKFSLRNPVALVILSLLVLAGGLYSATRFKQESMPELSLPYLFVTAIYPGASPQEVTNQVTLPMEQALKNIEGVKVGDKIDITYTQAMMVTVEPPKK